MAMAEDRMTIPRLVVTDPAEQAGLVFSLSGPQLVIGQSASADLVIDDPYVSGRHALVTIDGSGRVTIGDLNSTSGTFVNGERITGARVLEPGDRVQFADVVARFEAGPRRQRRGPQTRRRPRRHGDPSARRQPGNGPRPGTARRR